ncbi:MAG: S-layer homology domain-containing protein [Leptolyngbya sp. BL-A-14]
MGESLQKSFAADPKLETSASPEPSAAPVNSTTPQPQPSILASESPVPTLSPSATPSLAPQPRIPSIPDLSDSTVVGASGTSDGSPIPAASASANANTSGNATNGQSQAAPVAIDFTDLNKTPKELQQYVSDLAKLGVLTPATENGKAASAKDSALFAPNKVITRREYARWLVAANNRLYASQPAKQIRLSTDTTQPAFQDVPRNDPDFPAIQGLAEAGLLPSPLSGDSTTVTFRPDAPLTRENLILWKVPADTRQALPTASLDALKQTWGFQDAARIDPKAQRAVLADFQNGDSSNIRRAFGYTTLFQPKKSVTRAEAAAALWYFGFQGDGQSAQEALKALNAASNASP